MDSSAELHAILADLAAVQVALRRSSTAFDTAVAGMRGALDGIAAANLAQAQAIDAVIAATEKALRLVTSTGRH
jgi:poly-gamma-glutamate capsule biosynthesis protein CapA/YwtB (metallophosphatase superfamily)